MDLNDRLKVAFQKNQREVVKGINTDVQIQSFCDAMFEECVINANDHVQIMSSAAKATQLLIKLHTGVHPKAFVLLRDLMAKEPTCKPIVDKLNAMANSG